ncbi:MAG: hypothetical protein HYY76_12290 [Acidobacteria bacterium]|nr:hypothetical protein [Acidobacteriota bacterium]MBI3049077.1 hypothetical protein [Acidobacteriota bacterium]
MCIELVLGLVNALAWPLVALIVAIAYRRVLRGLMPGSRIKFSISGVEFETSIPELERSVEENLHGRKLSGDQWNWLRRLRDDGRTKYDHANYEALRPLRNAGLIREHPEGTLTACEEIEITHLGRLLVNARDKRGAA